MQCRRTSKVAAAAVAALLAFSQTAFAAGTITSFPQATVPLGNASDAMLIDQGSGCPTSSAPCVTSQVPSLRVGQPIQSTSTPLSPFLYQWWWNTGVSPPQLQLYDGSQFFNLLNLNSSTHALTLTPSIVTAGTSMSTPAMTVTGSTASTSSTTGALVVTGGVGIGGALNLGTVLGTASGGTGQGGPWTTAAIPFLNTPTQFTDDPVFVYDGTNHRLGITINNPRVTLDLGSNSASNFTGYTNTVAYIGFGGPFGSSFGGVVIGAGAGGANPFIGSSNTGTGSALPLAIWTGGTQAAVFSTAGYFGLGITSPRVLIDTGTNSSNNLTGYVNYTAYFGIVGGATVNTYGGVLIGAGTNGNTPFIGASNDGNGNKLNLQLWAGQAAGVTIDTNQHVGVKTLASATTTPMCYDTSTITGFNTFTPCSALVTTGGLTVGSGTMITSTTNFTNGAAGSSPTLGSAGPAGATTPTKWIPINDNGTTRYVAAW